MLSDDTQGRVLMTRLVLSFGCHYTQQYSGPFRSLTYLYNTPNLFQIWKNMQAFLGRTGKEGLKRQVTTLEPSKIVLSMADYAERVYLSKSDLDSIRDVSAGAATFFVWVSAKFHLVFTWTNTNYFYFK